MDKSNYQVWRAQFIAILKGNRLLKYVEEDRMMEDSIEIQQDQLIIRWFLSSISSAVLSGMTSCVTS